MTTKSATYLRMLVTLIACALLAVAAKAAPITGLGVMGDSRADEYRADNNRGGSYGATTLNWLELLQKYRGVNVGPWGTRAVPRRTGYEFNWALDGETAAGLIADGQHTGLAGQVAAGQISHALIDIGANDFTTWNGTYAAIYDGTLDDAGVAAKVSTFVSNVALAVDTVQAAGSVSVVVANVTDRGPSPVFVAQFPDASKRARVTNAIVSLNQQLASFAANRTNVAIADTFNFGASILSQVDQNGDLHVGAELISLTVNGDEPHHLVIGDAEHAAARQRWAWLDPLGVGWGIRHSADGNGVECLILGGGHGDIPIEPGGGAAVADVVVEESVNVLIDFSRKPTGEMWGVGEKIRFVTAYAKRLFQRQGDLVGGRRREPLFQLLDEGARYIPQTIPAGNPDLALCVAAWQQFAEEGRNVGLGLCVLTQRSARVNKDVAELADAMVAFRTIGPNSLGAVLDWLGEHVERSRVKELSAQVRELPRGSALIVSPGWLKLEKVVPIRMRTTFDSSATPKAGERPRTARGEGAKPDLEKIRARMAETIERAKADDPKALRARIAELEKQAARGKPPATTPALAAHEIAVHRGQLEAVLEAAKGLEDELIAIEKAASSLRIAANVTIRHVLRARDTGSSALSKSLAKAPPIPPTFAHPESGHTPKASRPEGNHGAHFPQSRPSMPKTDGPSEAGGAERRLLTVLAQYGRPMHVTRLAIRSGYTNNGHFRNTLGGLRSKGWAEGKGEVAITAQGVIALGPFDALPTGSELFDYWKEKLGKPSGLLLDALRDGTELHVDELAARAGYTNNGHFRNTLGHLRSIELVIGKGRVRLSEGLSE